MNKILVTLNRVKIIAAGAVGSAIALYDVVTAGGIDLNGVLRPVLGDKIDVGRLLATTALIVTILRFAMQSKLFASTNHNGIDDPDEPKR